MRHVDRHRATTDKQTWCVGSAASCHTSPLLMPPLLTDNRGASSSGTSKGRPCTTNAPDRGFSLNVAKDVAHERARVDRLGVDEHSVTVITSSRSGVCAARLNGGPHVSHEPRLACRAAD